MQRFESTVFKIEELTPTVKQFHMTTPDDFKFKAGQFVTVIITLPEKRISRAYSIASDPSLDHIELCIKKVEGGVGSTFFHNLKEGEKLDVMGPAGHFCLNEINEDVIFISTGAGIAPHRSMIHELIKSGHQKKVHIITGYRHENETLFHKEFEDLCQTNSKISNQVIISKPSESYAGKKGRVKELIHNDLLNNSNSRFFICGLSDMINDVNDYLKSQGIQEDKIHFEKFD
jgi:ferredoxin-NADP reductase